MGRHYVPYNLLLSGVPGLALFFRLDPLNQPAVAFALAIALIVVLELGLFAFAWRYSYDEWPSLHDLNPLR